MYYDPSFRKTSSLMFPVSLEETLRPEFEFILTAWLAVSSGSNRCMSRQFGPFFMFLCPITENGIDPDLAQTTEGPPTFAHHDEPLMSVVLCHWDLEVLMDDGNAWLLLVLCTTGFLDSYLWENLHTQNTHKPPKLSPYPHCLLTWLPTSNRLSSKARSHLISPFLAGSSHWPPCSEQKSSNWMEHVCVREHYGAMTEVIPATLD